jgi:2-deoxy-D-gluconate 3-dehydrogenase
MAKKIQEFFNLSGKVAIITGAAMGIGKGIALRLAEAGAIVIISDINFEVAQETAKELNVAGYKAKAVQADNSRISDVEKTVNEAKSTFGDLHILVNNAGIYPMASAIDMTEAIWDKIMAINLKGAMFFSQAAARMMIARGHGGKIVNIASVDAFHPTGNLAGYDASKGGIVMLTKALAKEWAPKRINVNAIAPGAIQTPGSSIGLGNLSQAEREATTKSFLATIPIGRQGTPDDVAIATLFLTTEASDYITGTTLVVDGGYLVG